MYCNHVSLLRRSILRNPSSTSQQHRNLNVLLSVPKPTFQLDSLDQIPLEEITNAKAKIQSKQYKQAEPLLQRASDILKSSLGESNPLTLSITSQLLSLSFSLQNYSSAEKLALQLLKHNHQNSNLIMKQLIYSYYCQNKLDEAVGFCDQLIFDSKNKKQTQEISESLLTMGNIYLKKKQIDLAQKFYEQSIKTIDTNSQKSQTTVDKALNNVGFVLQWKNLPQPAIKFYDLAIFTINQAEEQKLEVASELQQFKAHILTNLGDAQLQMKELKQAEITLEEATKIYNKDEKTDPLALAACLHKIANVYQAKKSNILAEGLYNKSVDLYEKNATVLPETELLLYQTTNVYRDFAGFLRDIGRTRESQNYEQKAQEFDSRFEHK